MKPKAMARMAIDLIMTVLLLLLMAYHFTGDVVHEWMGASMFLLFIVHHILNIPWYKNLFRGRYGATRTLQTILNMLLLAATLGLMTSGLILSRHVFSALPISSGQAFGRSLHHVSAYWGFVLMSSHLGLHGKMIMAMFRKLFGMKEASTVRKWIFRSIALSVSAYGIYAFIRYQIGLYMFNIIQFSFFDYNQPVIFFFTEYLTIMGLFAIFFYYLNEGLTAQFKKKTI